VQSWDKIADNLKQRDWSFDLGLSPWFRSEQIWMLTRIATTASVLLTTRSLPAIDLQKLTAFRRPTYHAAYYLIYALAPDAADHQRRVFAVSRPSDLPFQFRRFNSARRARERYDAPPECCTVSSRRKVVGFGPENPQAFGEARAGTFIGRV
jgi:hypothetical protein